MTLSIKDPGSALTHFIGMILAGIAAVPLLAVAASNDGAGAVAAFAIFAASMVLLYAASTTSESRSHDDLYPDCRKLYAGLPDSSQRQHRNPAFDPGMEYCRDRYADQSILDHLPQVVLLFDLYFHGMALCRRSGPLSPVPSHSGFRMAGGRRRYLYYWWNHLRIEASVF